MHHIKKHQQKVALMQIQCSTECNNNKCTSNCIYLFLVILFGRFPFMTGNGILIEVSKNSI